MVGTETRAAKETPQPVNDFAPWEEWKRLCDSAKCSEETRSALEQFARASWNSLLHRLRGGSDIPEDGEVAGKFPWHRFESHCAIKQTPEGKSYKDWLFKREHLPYGTPADKIRSGAYFLIRWALEEYIRKEGRFRLPGWGRPQPSFDDELPSGGEGKTLTLHDLLPDNLDPSKEAEFRELGQLAVAEAEGIMAGLGVRQRLVLTAFALGIALSNPEVEEIARCKKSVLSDALKKTLRDIEDKIHEDYAGEDARGRALLLTGVKSAVCEMCLAPNNQPEMWQSRLFSLAADNEQ